jgi:hypothetical protein
LTGRLHRLLITLGSIFTGLTGVWSLSEADVLGIPDEVAALCTIAGAVAVAIANAIRANYPTEV